MASFNFLLNPDALPADKHDVVRSLESCMPCRVDVNATGKEDGTVQELVLCILRWDAETKALKLGAALPKGDRPMSKITGDIGALPDVPSNWFGSDEEGDNAIDFVCLPDKGGEFAITFFDWFRSLASPEPSLDYQPAVMSNEEFTDRVGKSCDQVIKDGRAAMAKRAQQQKPKEVAPPPAASKAMRKPLKKLPPKKSAPEPAPEAQPAAEPMAEDVKEEPKKEAEVVKQEEPKKKRTPAPKKQGSVSKDEAGNKQLLEMMAEIRDSLTSMRKVWQTLGESLAKV